MKIRYKLKEYMPDSMNLRHGAGMPDKGQGSRYENVGMEENILQKIGGWVQGKLKSDKPNAYSGISDYLKKLRFKTPQQIKNDVMKKVIQYAESSFKDNELEKKSYIKKSEDDLDILLKRRPEGITADLYKDFPKAAKEILDNYFNLKRVNKAKVQKPTPPPPPKEDGDDEIVVGPEHEIDKQPEASPRGLLGKKMPDWMLEAQTGNLKMKIKYKMKKSLGEEKGESPNENPDMDGDGVYSPAELEYHFDLNQDGEVTPDEYKDHVKWHEKHPEVFEMDESALEEEKPCWKGYEQIGMKVKYGKKVPNCVPVKEEYMATLEDGSPVCEACLYETILENKNILSEAEYQGHKVQLGKPTKGDVKKFKVYVRDPKTGNVKKVNFGDPNMRIKKSNPKRRKSFRARHHCENPGPRTKARYWSCRAW